MSIDKVIALYIGMHFEGECRALNRLADSVHEDVIVSIGSFRGQADCALALHAHVPVFCIDPRQGWVGEPHEFGDQDRPAWMQNALDIGVASKVRPIELPSLDVAKIWNQPVSFLFVDGNHTTVAADLEAWLPHVVPSGIVGVHDNNLPSIIAAVAARDDMVEFERADLSTFYRKEPLYEEFTYDGLTMLVRKGPYNKDDKYVLGEVRSYSLPDWLPRTILDIGGHIGSFSCWMASLHPNADIAVVEPETSGYLTLKRNTAGYPNITIYNARAGYDETPSVLFVDPVNSGSHQVIPQEVALPGQSTVPAPERLTIEQIKRSRGWTQIDLLKIDAEGAEDDVLLNCPADTLRATRWITGEFHFGYDHFMKTVGARLQLHGFSVVGTPDDGVSHSTFVAINRNWVVPAETVQVDIPYYKAGQPVPDDPDIEYGVVIEEEAAPGADRRYVGAHTNAKGEKVEVHADATKPTKPSVKPKRKTKKGLK